MHLIMITNQTNGNENFGVTKESKYHIKVLGPVILCIQIKVMILKYLFCRFITLYRRTKRIHTHSGKFTDRKGSKPELDRSFQKFSHHSSPYVLWK